MPCLLIDLLVTNKQKQNKVYTQVFPSFSNHSMSSFDQILNKKQITKLYKRCKKIKKNGKKGKQNKKKKNKKPRKKCEKYAWVKTSGSGLKHRKKVAELTSVGSVLEPYDHDNEIPALEKLLKKVKRIGKN